MILQGRLCTWLQACSLQHHAGPNHHGALSSLNPYCKTYCIISLYLANMSVAYSDMSGLQRNAAIIGMFAWTVLCTRVGRT